MVRRARELVPGSGLFARVRGNPVAANIEDGSAVSREGGHDGVIASAAARRWMPQGDRFRSGQTRPLGISRTWGLVTRADPSGIARISPFLPLRHRLGVGRAGWSSMRHPPEGKFIFTRR